MIEKIVCLFTAIDVSIAFDTVDRDVLLQMLEWYGIKHKVINSMMEERTQFVIVNVDG